MSEYQKPKGGIGKPVVILDEDIVLPVCSCGKEMSIVSFDRDEILFLPDDMRNDLLKSGFMKYQDGEYLLPICSNCVKGHEIPEERL